MSNSTARLAGAVAGAVLLGLASIAPATADAPQLETSSVTPTTMSVTDVLAAGTIYGPSGKPSSGALVQVLAEPGPDVLASLKEGDSYQQVLLASAVADARGRYTLSLDYGVLDKVTDASKQSDEPINITFTVESKDGFIAFGSALSHTVGARTASLVGVLETESVDVGVSRDTSASLDFNLEPVSTGMAAATAPMTPAAAGIPTNCALIQDLGARNVYLARTSATVTGGYTQRFTYSKGATSTIGMGYSYTGAAGTWSQSGTRTVSSTVTIGFPTSSTAGSRLAVTKYTFAKIKCTNGTTNTWYHQVRPLGHYGGATTAGSTAPTATACVRHLATTTFSKTNTTAVNFTNGAQLSTSGIGINLSASTGYTASAKYSVTFSSSRNLCSVGSGGPAGSNPREFVIKA